MHGFILLRYTRFPPLLLAIIPGGEELGKQTMRPVQAATLRLALYLAAGPTACSHSLSVCLQVSL